MNECSTLDVVTCTSATPSMLWRGRVFDPRCCDVDECSTSMLWRGRMFVSVDMVIVREAESMDVVTYVNAASVCGVSAALFLL